MGILDKLFNRKTNSNSLTVDEALLLLVYHSERRFQAQSFDENDFIETFVEDFPLWDKKTMQEKIRVVAPLLNDHKMIDSSYSAVLDLPVKRKISALLNSCIYTCHKVKSAGIGNLRQYVDAICKPAFRPTEQAQYDMAFNEMRDQIFDAVRESLNKYSSELISFETAKAYFRLNSEPSDDDQIKYLLRLNKEGKHEGVGLSFKRFLSIPVLNLMVDFWGVPASTIWSIAEINTQKENNEKMTPEDVNKTLEEIKEATAYVLKEAEEKFNKQNHQADESGVKFTDPEIRAIVQEKLKSNKTEFSQSELSNIDIIFLTSLKQSDGADIVKLTELKIVYITSAEKFNYANLLSLKKLSRLSINFGKLLDCSIISQLKNVTELDLNYNEIYDISQLAAMTQLSALSLINNKIKDISAIASLHNLVSLNISNNPISSIAPLQTLNKLGQLAFDYCQVMNIRPLAKLGELNKLSCNHNQISDISVMQILKKLSEIDLTGNMIQDVTPLVGFSKSVKIDLSENEITDWHELGDRKNVKKKKQRPPQNLQPALTSTGTIGNLTIDTAKGLIAVGSSFIVGVNPDGTVRSAGLLPKNREIVDSWSDITAVCASDKHILALKKDGTVIATGRNEDKECNVGTWRNIAAIAAGNDHSLGLKRDGSVVAQGSNLLNQCNVESWQGITAISASRWMSAGLKKDGSVVLAGMNSVLNQQTSCWQDVIALAVGCNHIVGLRKDGTVVVAGDQNDSCEISEWKKIKAIYEGNNYTIGLQENNIFFATRYFAEKLHDLSLWRDIVTLGIGNDADFVIGLRKDGMVLTTGKCSKKECNQISWNLLGTAIATPAVQKIETKQGADKQPINIKGLQSYKTSSEEQIMVKDDLALTLPKGFMASMHPSKLKSGVGRTFVAMKQDSGSFQNPYDSDIAVIFLQEVETDSRQAAADYALLQMRMASDEEVREFSLDHSENKVFVMIWMKQDWGIMTYFNFAVNRKLYLAQLRLPLDAKGDLWAPVEEWVQRFSTLIAPAVADSPKQPEQAAKITVKKYNATEPGPNFIRKLDDVVTEAVKTDLVHKKQKQKELVYSQELANKNKQEKINIPFGYTSIGYYAFADREDITAVYIPDTIKIIEDYAFEKCKNLSQIVIPDGVTSIGVRAFAFCWNLKVMVLPDSITSIESGTFYNSGLQKIIIPDSVIAIEETAFWGVEETITIECPKYSYAWQYCQEKEITMVES